jgi:hypothetical protein
MLFVPAICARVKAPVSRSKYVDVECADTNGPNENNDSDDSSEYDTSFIDDEVEEDMCDTTSDESESDEDETEEETLRKKRRHIKEGKKPEKPAPKKMKATVKQPVKVKGPGTTKVKPTVQKKELELSITVGVHGTDVSDETIKLFDTWSKSPEVLKYFYGVEKGGTLSQRHVQGVVRVVAASANVVSRIIREALMWVRGRHADVPAGATVMCKTLRNTGLHTFSGMIGYCMKDEGLEHYQVGRHNVTDAEMEGAKEQYIKYGAGPLKIK